MAKPATRPTSAARRNFLIGLGAAVGATVVGCASDSNGSKAGRPRAGRSTRPNVLYVTADDLGTRLGAYGHRIVSSPRIDAFAKESLLFERCYSQIAICGAARVSILTGLRPETTGVLRNEDSWHKAAPHARSLVRSFRQAGYRTYGIGKVEDLRNGELDDAWDERRGQGRLDNDTSEIRDLIHQVSDEGAAPWFLAIGFHQPHCPWDPSAESLKRYEGVDVLEEAGPERSVYAGFVPHCTPETRPEIKKSTWKGEVQFTEAEVSDLVRRYLASVTDMDGMFGDVLDTAASRNLLDNTIVIFWSGDHGFQLGDGASGWGKWSCYDASTRVPLIMQLPGMAAGGRRAPGLVEAVDMYPTLLELCDLPRPPQQLDGHSFAPLFRQPEQSWKKAAFSRYLACRSVKTEHHNLIVNEDSTPEPVQLFDLDVDPHEQTNIAAAQPGLVGELMAIMQAGPQAAFPRQ